MVDGGGNNRHSRPVSTMYETADFKPQRFPQLLLSTPASGHHPHHEKAGPRNSSNVITSSKLEKSSMYSPSNLARFQSTPNIASPDLYGGHSSHKRIDALKSQGKNIQQKFKNLFVRKQNRKNFNLATSESEQPKRRTTSNHDFDDDEEQEHHHQEVPLRQPQELIIPAKKREENNNNDRSSVYIQKTTPQTTQYRSSGKIDTDVDFTGKFWNFNLNFNFEL